MLSILSSREARMFASWEGVCSHIRGGYGSMLPACRDKFKKMYESRWTECWDGWRLDKYKTRQLADKLLYEVGCHGLFEE